MNYIYNFYDFINEGTLVDKSKKIDIKFKIDADQHFYDRLSRSNNEPDENGDIIIDENEVIKDVEMCLNQLVNSNLFNIGIYWLNKSDKLNSDILVINKKTNLNTLLDISKQKDKYIITIKSVMRKKDFKPSYKENTKIIFI
jgi:hypothetical protein